MFNSCLSQALSKWDGGLQPTAAFLRLLTDLHLWGADPNLTDTIKP